MQNLSRTFVTCEKNNESNQLENEVSNEAYSNNSDCNSVLEAPNHESNIKNSRKRKHSPEKAKNAESLLSVDKYIRQATSNGETIVSREVALSK